MLALPFPRKDEEGDDGARGSGPGHHLVVLRESVDFWDDRCEDTVERAEEEIDTERIAAARVLTERLCAPETVDLWPYPAVGAFDDAGEVAEGGGEPAPEPPAQLCNLAGSMQVWRAPGRDRWLGLAVGQADREFPVRLLAAVGENPLPAP